MRDAQHTRDDAPPLSLPTIPALPFEVARGAAPVRPPMVSAPEPPPIPVPAADPHDEWHGLRPGSTFGRYRIERRLGEGAMGIVLLARDTALDRLVALKIPRFDASTEVDARQRFLREARSAAVLRHRNICPIHDVGEISGVLHFTMGYIEGNSLASLIAEKRRFKLRTVAQIVRKLSRALAEAHRAGVIHRDIKPSNILIDRAIEPVLLDFGLARSYTNRDERVTPTGEMCGTPAYMSPEQVLGQTSELGPATDIYSLGIVFYELLTGSRPFQGTLGAMLSAILDQQPIAPRLLRVGLDPALDAICLRMIAKTPAERFADMNEVKAAMTKYLADNPK